MLYGLLNSDPARFVKIGEASLYALIGFLVVFCGISFLILIVWLVGKLLVKVEKNAREKTIKQSQASIPEKKEPIVENLSIAEAKEERVSDETVVLIMAALMAYYEKNNPKCEFTVKRIKKI